MGDDAVRYCAGCCCCGGLITAIVLIAISFSVLEATEMGLDYSSVSKSVSDEKLYPAGRHMLGVGHSFKKYLHIRRLSYVVVVVVRSIVGVLVGLLLVLLFSHSSN